MSDVRLEPWPRSREILGDATTLRALLGLPAPLLEAAAAAAADDARAAGLDSGLSAAIRSRSPIAHAGQPFFDAELTLTYLMPAAISAAWACALARDGEYEKASALIHPEVQMGVGALARTYLGLGVRRSWREEGRPTSTPGFTLLGVDEIVEVTSRELFEHELRAVGGSPPAHSAEILLKPTPPGSWGSLDGRQGRELAGLVPGDAVALDYCDRHMFWARYLGRAFADAAVAGSQNPWHLLGTVWFRPRIDPWWEETDPDWEYDEEQDAARMWELWPDLNNEAAEDLPELLAGLSMWGSQPLLSLYGRVTPRNLVSSEPCHWDCVVAGVEWLLRNGHYAHVLVKAEAIDPAGFPIEAEALGDAPLPRLGPLGTRRLWLTTRLAYAQLKQQGDSESTLAQVARQSTPFEFSHLDSAAADQIRLLLTWQHLQSYAAGKLDGRQGNGAKLDAIHSMVGVGNRTLFGIAERVAAIQDALRDQVDLLLDQVIKVDSTLAAITDQSYLNLRNELAALWSEPSGRQAAELLQPDVEGLCGSDAWALLGADSQADLWAYVVLSRHDRADTLRLRALALLLAFERELRSRLGGLSGVMLAELLRQGRSLADDTPLRRIARSASANGLLKVRNRIAHGDRPTDDELHSVIALLLNDGRKVGLIGRLAAI